MIVKAKELIGALKAALLFASTDIARTSINCVHLEAVGSAIRVVSTNGHTLWCCEVPATDDVNDPAPAYQTPWNVSVDDAEGLVRQLKGNEEARIYLAKRVVNGLEYKQQTENFAPYHLVVPAVFALGGVIPEFASEYVELGAKALACYGAGFAPEVPKVGSKDQKDSIRIARISYLNPPMAVRLGGELEPAMFYSPKFPNAFLIVMPCKGEGRKNYAIVDRFAESVRTQKAVAA